MQKRPNPGLALLALFLIGCSFESAPYPGTYTTYTNPSALRCSHKQGSLSTIAVFSPLGTYSLLTDDGRMPLIHIVLFVRNTSPRDMLIDPNGFELGIETVSGKLHQALSIDRGHHLHVAESSSTAVIQLYFLSPPAIDGHEVRVLDLHPRGQSSSSPLDYTWCSEGSYL